MKDTENPYEYIEKVKNDKSSETMKECLLNEVDIKEIRAEGASLEKYYMELMKKVK